MDAEIEMAVILCASCGMPFGITKDLQDRLRKSHENFFCPKGHSQSYRAKSEEELLKEKLSEKEELIRIQSETIDKLTQKKKVVRKKPTSSVLQKKKGKRT